MTQYIEKAAVVAEIERRLKVQKKDRFFNYLQIKELEALLSFLDNLEVKEVTWNKCGVVADGRHIPLEKTPFEKPKE